MNWSAFLITTTIFTFSFQVVFSQIPLEGLIAEWLFEENLNDTKSTGTPYDLSVIQGEASYLTGINGKALYLNGETKINNTNQNLVTIVEVVSLFMQMKCINYIKKTCKVLT